MKFLLVYYSQFDGDKVFEEDNPSLGQYKGSRIPVDHDKVDQFIARNRPPGDTAMFMRSAEAFDGNVEHHEDSEPLRVVLIGNGSAIDRVAETYEAAGIEVSHGSLDDDGSNGSIASSSEDDGDKWGGDIDKLKERATDLGVQFSPTIGYNTLLERVLIAEKRDDATRDNDPA